MLKRKCPGCDRKVERKFNYCPYCGMSFKVKKEKDDFGMLGRDDFLPETEKNSNQGFKLPFGLDGIFNGLMKQLENEMAKEMREMPQGFKIHISTGKPEIKKVQSVKRTIKQPVMISDDELKRRMKLPKTEAESNVRRLPDRIVYEIQVPGVKSGRDVVVTKLEDSIEVKAYSGDKCFYKTIPLKVEIIGYYIKDDRLFVELKD